MNNHTDNNPFNKGWNALEVFKKLQRYREQSKKLIDYHKQNELYWQQFRNSFAKGIAAGTDLSGNLLYTHPDRVFT